jgi:hypothetical protein
MSMTQCSKCGCSYSHSGQTSCPSCTSHARAYRISTERYSFDSSIYGPPGNPQAYHQISIEICREPNQRAYVSRRSDSLVPVVIDDALVIDGHAAASFNGVLNPALPLGRPIDTILGAYPPRDVTTLFPAGISNHYFECVDTHRSIAGNTELWLVIQ